jgi:succinyl-CoA synthetase beta subunit
LNIHEYQAKEILARYGIKIPKGGVISNFQEAERGVQASGPGPFVVKAQVHAGGRGKGGGIRRAKDSAEVAAIARKMLGSKLVTPQSGAQGKPINRVLVEESLPIESELYLGVTIDRGQEKVAVIGCSEGGMEIEEIGARSPEKIHKMIAEPGCGFTLYQGRRLAMNMGLEGGNIGKGAAVAVGLFRAFMDNDCSLAEINPLVLTTAGNIVALDCKMNIDDNALYRHPEIVALRDITQEDPQDVEAARLNLSYINLTGNIGCVVNGAGLGMATMDILLYYGGEPANFLDAGAGATEDTIRNAFGLLLSDPKVKGILVNMFGGITRCDSYAKGIVDGLRGKALPLPFVIRMEGTNVELGKKILAESGLNYLFAESMQEAAQKIVELVKTN